VFDGNAVVSLPVRLHPAYIPHVVLIAVIVLASALDVMMTAMSWISGI
jgi:hypothetical protein